MLATSRMWRSTRSTHAAWGPPLRAGPPAVKGLLERAVQFQTAFRRGSLLPVRTWSLRPIQRWACLIRSDRAVAEAAGVAAAAAAVRAVAAQVAVGRVAPVAQVAVGKVAPVGAVAQAAVKAAPAGAQGGTRGVGGGR